MKDVTIAKILLDSDAVSFRADEPYRYSSGLLSPIYTDNRVLISHPDQRKVIAKAFSELLSANYRNIQCVAGTSTAGIPWAAWLAEKLNLPMIYVRDRAKRHGQKNQISGVLKPGSHTIIVEDLISTGQSALNAAAAVRRAGGIPLAVLAIFTYQMQVAADNFKQAGIPLHTLTNFRTLTDEALRQGILTSESSKSVLQWAEDPKAWSSMMEQHE